jgi:Leucine-rich repeat (LRR) protein
VVGIILPQNNVTGQFPLNAALPTTLQSLDLSQNQFTGSIMATDYYNNSTPQLQVMNLTSLILDNNQLNGTLSSHLGSMLGALQELHIAFNQINGRLPSELGKLVALTDLSFASNNLSGSIPTSFGQLQQLRNFDLSSNGFSGPLPSIIGLLRSAVTIHLQTNNMIGSIPTEVGLLTQLQSIYLDLNYFNGSIPTELFRLSNTLEHVSVSGNSFSGTISTLIGGMANMSTFDCNRLMRCFEVCQIILDAPHALLCCHDLLLGDWIITQNNITGTIPTQFGRCTSLVQLELDQNQLHGTVPSELGLLSRLSEFGFAVALYKIIM